MNGKYHPDLQDYYGGKSQQLSLRACAMQDAIKSGVSSTDFNDMRRKRSRNRQRGQKTNIGDPSRSNRR